MGSSNTETSNALSGIEDRVRELEERMNAKDVEFAIINTKLSAILWGVGIIGTAMIGVLVKLLFNV